MEIDYWHRMPRLFRRINMNLHRGRRHVVTWHCGAWLTVCRLWMVCVCTCTCMTVPKISRACVLCVCAWLCTACGGEVSLPVVCFDRPHSQAWPERRWNTLFEAATNITVYYWLSTQHLALANLWRPKCACAQVLGALGTCHVLKQFTAKWYSLLLTPMPALMVAMLAIFTDTRIVTAALLYVPMILAFNLSLPLTSIEWSRQLEYPRAP